MNLKFRILKSGGIALFCLFQASFAKSSPTDAWPGLIPIGDQRPPATDLYEQGRVLTQDEVHAIADSSLIDPDPTTDLWRDEFPASPVIPSDRILSLDSTLTSVRYVDELISRAGNFRFSVIHEGPEGHSRNLILLASKRAHNVLLRQALLRKIGYRVPPVQAVPRIRIEFESSIQRELFQQNLSIATAGDDDRWVSDSDDPASLILQDLILFEGMDPFYNLSHGYVPAQVIRQRRLLNALLVPFSLTEVPESINLFQWQAGRVFNRMIRLPYESAEEFDTSFEDARWIVRRILKLTRGDFRQIVEAARLPAPVAALLVEKLIARRNHLRELFDLPGRDLEFNSKISIFPHLKDGKFLRETWPGHASRFSYNDPESPFSQGELGEFIKSIGVSAAISSVVGQANSTIIASTDLQKELSERASLEQTKRFLEYLAGGGTGPMPTAKVGAWIVPVATGNVIASRDVVFGNYLGSDNLVQLADTIGFSAQLGALAVIHDLPQPLGLMGSAYSYLTRTYTHLKPIRTMKAANSYPFHHLLVPLFENRLAGNLNVPPQAQIDQIKPIIGIFKESLQIGESLIISDQVGMGLNLRANATQFEVLRAMARFEAGQLMISRLHILRTGENTIQVYKDVGNVRHFTVAFELHAMIPIFSIGATFRDGNAETRFYQVNLDTDPSRNPGIEFQVAALRLALAHHSVELLEKAAPPFRLRHRFREAIGQIGALFFKAENLNQSTWMGVQHPLGPIKRFYRRSFGNRIGNDFQRFTTESIGALASFLVRNDVNLNFASSGDPGESIFGTSRSHVITVEGEITNTQDSEAIYLKDLMVRMAYHWRDWNLSRSAAQDILNRLSAKYRFLYPSRTTLQQTRNIFLSHIDLRLLVYPESIEALLNLDDQKIIRIFTKKVGWVRPNGKLDRNPMPAGEIRNFLNRRQEYFRCARKGEIECYTQKLSEMIRFAEERLSLEGLTELFGGERGFYIYSRISGFRSGAEDGNEPLLSNSYGEFGNDRVSGPLDYLRNQLGMTESEFFLYWLLRRY